MFTSESKKQVAAFLVVAQLFFFEGGTVFAQTTTDPIDPVPAAEVVIVSTSSSLETVTLPPEEVLVPPTSDPDPIVVSTSSEETIDLQGASSTPVLQDTFSEQQPTSPEEVASSTDVTIATSTDATSTDQLPSEEDPTASTTPDDQIAPQVEPTPEPTPTPEPEPTQPAPTPQVINNAEPIVLSSEELRPDPEYTFSINSGKKVSSSRRVVKKEVVRGKTVETVVNEVVNTVPQLAVNNVEGVMTVSGACEDKYYVILVYKHQEDYSQDKRSYIVNRAFPCEGSTFSYDLRELPPTLADGTYYLLVGRMGENTPWEPSTALTEITLQRNHP